MPHVIKDNKLPIAYKLKGKRYCVPCFNGLPAAKTGGRGALEAGWYMDNQVVEKTKCCKCNKDIVVLDESGSRF